MTITLKEVKNVFLKWNKFILENPSEINRDPLTLDNVEIQSEAQSNEFMDTLLKIKDVV